MSDSRKHNRRSKHADAAFPYLRDASVTGAVTGVRNKNVFPVFIPARHMPEGQGAYSNYREVKYEFWAWYCALEGISITSDFARKVLLYIFYGHYQHKVTEKKVTRFVRKPIIHGIHYKLTNG